MHRVWTFSTLQRPTQEERERRRKFRRGEDDNNNNNYDGSKPGGPTDNKKSLLRSKTFRHSNGSASTSEPNIDLLYLLQNRTRSNRSKSSQREYESKKAQKVLNNSGNGFVSRLRFHEEPQKIRWQDREPLNNNSSGYSSGGGQSKDENIYGDNTYGISGGEMVSRRKILSRSRDDLNMDGQNPPEPDEEDVWYQKEKLYKDHIQEVLNKWESIDDEIWAKIIVLERNRRVAKAYARAPVLTVNGSDDGFDGFRIGLAGFENPMRDPKTEEVKRNIGQGCKIKMDDSGNILVKRIAKSNVYVKCISDENSISNDILKLPNGSLESEKPVKLFDMKKFQQNLNRELKRSYPDRRKLECQCISSIAFVRNENELLDSPCWIMLINVVAMDMLKSKIPPVRSNNPRSAIDIRNRPRIPIPDEDPYSVAGSGSSGSSGNGNRERSKDKPPKLPPRDLSRDIYAGFGKGEYPEHMDEQRFRQLQESRRRQSKKGEKKSGDDPYYCGLRARIPNFAKTRAQREKEAANNRYASTVVGSTTTAGMGPLYAPLRGVYMENGKRPQNPLKASNMAPPHAMMPPSVNGSIYGMRPPPGMVGNLINGRPFERNPTTWVPDTPMRNVIDFDSDYSHIYGRLPFPTRGFRQYPSPPGPPMYVSEWE